MAGILRELTLLQEREGWLPEPALREIAERLGVPLHRVESVSTFYTHFRRTPPTGTAVLVCRDVACRMAGHDAVTASLRDRADVEVREVSCLGRCDAAPAACVGHRVVGLRDATAIDDALEQPAVRLRPSSTWSPDLDAESRTPYASLDRLLALDGRDVVLHGYMVPFSADGDEVREHGTAPTMPDSDSSTRTASG